MTHQAPKKQLQEILLSSIGGIWGDNPGESEVDASVIRVTELKPNGGLDVSTAVVRSMTEKQLASRILREGDIILEKSGGGPNTPVGRVALIPEFTEPYVCSNFMLVMRAKTDEILSKYLHYFLTYLHLSGKTIPLQSSTTNIRNISTPDYMKVEIPIPSLPNQIEIVDNLDDLTSKLDKALEQVGKVGGLPKAESVTSQIANLRLSILHSVFEGSLFTEGK
jgi:type I restriction enzyme S subunit